MPKPLMQLRRMTLLSLYNGAVPSLSCCLVNSSPDSWVVSAQARRAYIVSIIHNPRCINGDCLGGQRGPSHSRKLPGAIHYTSSFPGLRDRKWPESQSQVKRPVLAGLCLHWLCGLGQVTRALWGNGEVETHAPPKCPLQVTEQR